MAGPKLSGCLPYRSSWTQVIRIFTSQKWLDPSYQAAYQLEVAGPKLSGFSPVKHGKDPSYQDSSYQLEVTSYQDFHLKSGPKLSGCLPVRSSWTQAIRIFTSQKWQDPSYQAAYQLEVAGPKLSGFSPVKSGWTQVIRLLTS